jgi:hypothetical protein
MRRILFTALIAGLAGCQNPPAAPQAPLVETPKAPAKPDLLKTAYQNSAADLECAENLHKIEGLLMMYAAMRGQLPPSLDKLVPLNDGKPLPGVCPLSKKEYVYVAQGMVASGDSRMIVLYDATPAHDGKRQAIVLMPEKDGQAPFLDIAMITDDVLKLFKPAATTRP